MTSQSVFRLVVVTGRILQTADPRARLESLLAQREPLYRHLADLIISTDGRKVRQVATEIRALLEGAGE